MKIIKWLATYGGVLIIASGFVWSLVYRAGWMGFGVLLGIVGLSVWATYGIIKYIEYTIERDKKL